MDTITCTGCEVTMTELGHSDLVHCMACGTLASSLISMGV